MEKYNSGWTAIFKLEIDENAKSSFLDIARWTKFLAVLGLVQGQSGASVPQDHSWHSNSACLQQALT